MKTQRDAILGYAKELHAYYIQFIENNTLLDTCYGLSCQNDEQAENVMTTLLMKKSFWIDGSAFQDIIKGLHPLTTTHVHAA